MMFFADHHLQFTFVYQIRFRSVSPGIKNVQKDRVVLFFLERARTGLRVENHDQFQLWSQLSVVCVAGGRLRWHLVLSSLWLRQSIPGNNPSQLKQIKDRARQSGSEFKVKRERNFYNKLFCIVIFKHVAISI